MNVEMHGPISEALKAHTDARLEAALGQHETHVERVVVKVSDLNGPRGGVDKQCHLTVHLHKWPEVIIEERGEDVYAVVSTAANRAKNAVARAIDKQRGKRHLGV